MIEQGIVTRRFWSARPPSARMLQLIAAFMKSRDQTDVCYVFEDHQGSILDFEMPCRCFGVSKDDWDYAMSEGGIYFLAAIIGKQMGLPRYDPHCLKTT
jgi:hypothetical protein